MTTIVKSIEVNPTGQRRRSGWINFLGACNVVVILLTVPVTALQGMRFGFGRQYFEEMTTLEIIETILWTGAITLLFTFSLYVHSRFLKWSGRYPHLFANLLIAVAVFVSATVIDATVGPNDPWKAIDALIYAPVLLLTIVAPFALRSSAVKAAFVR